MSNLLGTKIHPKTAYHPQANGLVERFHRSLKAALKARLAGPNWTSELPWVLLGLRTAPKEDLNASPAELVYGAPITVPGDFIQDVPQTPVEEQLKRLRERVGNLRPVPTGAHGAKRGKFYVPNSLTSAKFVFIRREFKKTPLQTPYDGPYEVLARHDKYFTLRMGTKEETVTVDRLKPAYIEKDNQVQVAQQPRWGRPPTNPERPVTPLTVQEPQVHREFHCPDQIPHRQRSPERQQTYAKVTTRAGRTTKQPQRFKS